MSHDIDVINGVAATAAARELGWHKLGTLLPEQVSGPEMLKAATLDWNVVKQPLFTTAVGDPSMLLAVKDRVAIVRDVDQRVIGTVGATYQPIQNEEIFAFADALLEVDGGVKFETAGALNGGRVVWALASMPERAFTVEGDPQGQVMPYLLLNSGHDGLRAFQLAFTPVRVVCANTLAMALRGARTNFVIRHTVNAGEKIEAARKGLGIHVETLETLRAVNVELMQRDMSIKDIIKATEKLIPSMAEDEEKAVKAQAQRDLIIDLYRNSANLDGVPETAYRFVQAVAEYADHERVYRKTKKGNADEARSLAVLDGTAAKLKSAALALVLPQAAPRGARGRFVSPKP